MKKCVGKSMYDETIVDRYTVDQSMGCINYNRFKFMCVFFVIKWTTNVCNIHNSSFQKQKLNYNSN